MGVCLYVPLGYCLMIFPCAFPCARRPPRLCKRIRSVLLFVGRKLCLSVFPALFKVHKTHSDSGTQSTREFLVFLDRKVENNAGIVFSFCSLAYATISLSAMGFFQYFPVAVSRECLEEDHYGRTLFCYTTSSIDSRISSPPVDCLQYNFTEIRELHFRCYAIAVPGFGIGLAAALAIAKMAVVGITVYIRATEGFFKMTKDPPQKLKMCFSCCIPRWCCCHCNRKCANKVYIVSSLAVLGLVAVAIIAVYFSINMLNLAVGVTNKAYYLSYATLPFLVWIPLVFIVVLSEGHCEQGEYVSLTSEQRPLDPPDWHIDVGSESSLAEEQQDESEQALGEHRNERDVAAMAMEKTLPLLTSN